MTAKTDAERKREQRERDKLRKGPLYAAPPAAERPDTIPVSKKLLDQVITTLEKDRRWIEAGRLRALLAGGDKQ